MGPLLDSHPSCVQAGMGGGGFQRNKLVPPSKHCHGSKFMAHASDRWSETVSDTCCASLYLSASPGLTFLLRRVRKWSQPL